MKDVAFDPNPPLSIILYFPVVLAQKYLSLPLHIGITLQSFLILAISTFMLNWSLKTGFSLTVLSRYAAVTGYILMNTIASGLVFGERDHLIAMTLPAFLTIQLGLTYGTIKADTRVWLFCALASFLILVKPPHGLLPSLLLCHRVIRNRNLKALLDADFLALSFMTLLYATAIWFFFRDYTEIILPDMFSYYYPSISDAHLLNNVLPLGASALVIGLGAYFSRIDTASKRMIAMLSFGAAISVIPIIIQGKGFYYHYLPSLSFLAAAGTLLFYEWVFKETRKAHGAAFCTLIVGLLLSYCAAPLDSTYPRHSTYADLPLPREIANTAKGKNIFIFNSDMALSHEISYYTGTVHASRFPSLWFLPGLINARENNLDDWKANTERYAEMVAEDLDKYQPAVVLLIDPAYFDPEIDFIKTFSLSPAFNKAWGHYRYMQSTTVDEKDYLGTTEMHGPPKIFRIYQRH